MRVHKAAFVAVTVALASAVGGGVSPAAAAERPLEIGVFEPREVFASDAATWLGRIKAVGGSSTRIPVYWRSIAQKKPSDARNPSDPAYNFSALDRAVSVAIQTGLRPFLGVSLAPDWAEAPGRPQKGSPAGTWRPSAAALGDFGAALAQRYPSVSLFSAWNEPNLDIDLTPQWNANRTPASPDIYRRMLNAFYDGVKSVNPKAQIIGGTTSPYGDLQAGNGPSGRMPPAVFLRRLLCIGPGLTRVRGTCGPPARFDVLDHHPYGIRGPLSPALNADDVAIPDLGKLTQPLNAAVRLRTVYPAKRKRLWITEVSWDSNPPDPDGVPMSTLARWLPQTLYKLWDQGADTIMWFLAADQLPKPSFAATYQSGLWFADGRPKVLVGIYRFPLLVVKRSGRQVAWLRTPAAGKVRVERMVRGRWQTAASSSASSGKVVLLPMPRLRSGARVRAVAGDGSVSSVWRVGGA